MVEGLHYRGFGPEPAHVLGLDSRKHRLGSGHDRGDRYDSDEFGSLVVPNRFSCSGPALHVDGRKTENSITTMATAKPKQQAISAWRVRQEIESETLSGRARKLMRYFKTGEGEYGAGDKFIGVRMGHVFALTKEFVQMTPDEIEKLLADDIHEVRAGAVSIMNQQARDKKTSDNRRKELFDLYLRRHDRINNWNLVDLGAPYVSWVSGR